MLLFQASFASLSPHVSRIHGVSWVIFLLSYFLSVLTSFIHTLAVFSISVCSSDIVPVKAPGLQFLSEVSCGDFCFLAPMLSSFSLPLRNRRGSGYSLEHAVLAHSCSARAHSPAWPHPEQSAPSTKSSTGRRGARPWGWGSAGVVQVCFSRER